MWPGSGRLTVMLPAMQPSVLPQPTMPAIVSSFMQLRVARMSVAISGDANPLGIAVGNIAILQFLDLLISHIGLGNALNVFTGVQHNGHLALDHQRKVSIVYSVVVD
jgi:hypothetical protein